MWSPGVAIESSVRELRRSVEEMGVVGCNFNPDPSGGMWNGPTLADRAYWPLYDALYDMLDVESVGRLMDRGTIEVAPLAFMRGRTLNDSFIILDEAQNTTPEQMKMFLTRLGFGSRMVITGDVTQIDLPEGRDRSGLLAVREILEGVEGLAFVDLDSRDVVRHRIVQSIVDAYERARP